MKSNFTDNFLYLFQDNKILTIALPYKMNNQTLKSVSIKVGKETYTGAYK